VKETWQSYELEMINYQNKCRLIRGWDDLFNKLKENINQVDILLFLQESRRFSS